ncbi:MAG TPA: nitroreductase family deazaflavin-dependent oxidoreductase [Chloroflexota bacterium]|nr:nitroreductase family deazaflavin-dependent oxidoreductase [Chloroflexota bacterium]
MNPSAAPRRPPRWLFRLLNPLFTALLRSPLHGLLSGRLLLLTFRGRRSGKLYTIPVGYAQVDDRHLLLGTESAWKANLRGGARVRLRLRGHGRYGAARVIDDAAGMAAAYRQMLEAAPGYGRAIGITLGPDGEPDPTDVARARAAGHVVVEIVLE